jgi:hypothetical protein
MLKGTTVIAYIVYLISFSLDISYITIKLTADSVLNLEGVLKCIFQVGGAKEGIYSGKLSCCFISL